MKLFTDKTPHIMLTGDHNVGKTTIINNTLKELQSRLKSSGSSLTISGFKTVKVNDEINQKSSVYICPINNELNPSNNLSELENNLSEHANNLLEHANNLSERNLVSTWHFDDDFSVVHSQVFDDIGVKSLEVSTSDFIPDLIIMDELGFLEKDAFSFREKVMECINGDVPILGVVKLKDYEFTNSIKQHPKVKIIEVTVDNRDAIKDIILDMILDE